MNRERLTTLKALKERIEDLQEQIAHTLEEVREVNGEEQEAYDNMPAAIKLTSAKATKSENALEQLDTIIIELDDCNYKLERVLNAFEDLEG